MTATDATKVPRARGLPRGVEAVSRRGRVRVGDAPLSVAAASPETDEAFAATADDDHRVIRWLLVSWLANAVALGITAWLLAGVSVDGSGGTLVWAALVFGV